jgi:phage tail tube protein FII
MPIIPNAKTQVTTSINAFVDGYPMGAKLINHTPPVIDFNVVLIEGGATGGETEVPTTLKAMRHVLTIGDADPVVLGKLGLRTGVKTSFSILESTANTDGVKIPQQYLSEGKIIRYEEGETNVKNRKSVTVELAVDVYTKSVAGVPVVQIDNENMIRIIGGTDELALERALILRV